MLLAELRRMNLRRLLAEVSAADLSRRSGVSQTLISRYKSGNKSMSEDTARRLERAALKPPRWLDTDPALPTPIGDNAAFMPDSSPLLPWGELMTAKSPRFWTVLPDDAMAPRAPAGRRVLFDRGLTPIPGDGVLVKDGYGRLHFRQLRSGAGLRWTAVASNPSYEPLDSERDELTIVAVLCAEEGRWS